MTFMPYRFYTINTQAFLDNEIGAYFDEEGAIEWFKGSPPKDIAKLRLRDLFPIEEWLCEVPDAFPEWQFSRERIWGSINSMLDNSDISGVNFFYCSELGYDEINFFLHPNMAKWSIEKSLSPADLVEYWCGGEGNKPRWTIAHLLPPQRIAWFTMILEYTRENVRRRLSFARDNVDKEYIMEMMTELDTALEKMRIIKDQSNFDWMLIIC